MQSLSADTADAETAETESTDADSRSDFEGNTEQIETDAGQEETQQSIYKTEENHIPESLYMRDLEHIYMNTTWEYADHSAISDGYAVLYKAVRSEKEHCCRS